MSENNRYKFLNGGGTMGALTREFNWGSTSIGEPGDWPPTLRTMVSTVINSKLPMLLWWGNDLIQFYNDAYMPCLHNNAHPQSLGQKACDAWREIWKYIYPDIQQLQTDGSGIFKEDQPLRMFRNGQLEDVYLSLSFTPVHGDNDELGGILVTCIETTSQMHERGLIEERVAQRTRELADANAKLKQQNIELNQFAYIASHDLQEPLRKVRTFTSLLETSLGDINDRTRSYMTRIHTATERMQVLINDVLAFSRLSKHADKFKVVALADVVKNTLNDYDLLIDQKNALINIGPLPQVEAIYLQMNQLFTNIISNALKFSRPDKQLTITLESHELGEEEVGQYPELDPVRKYFKIDFIDNGIGFEQSHAQQIFVIFQRLHGRSDYDGTGIGLALCKKIIQNHHGVITATSTPNQGSTFTIILPEKQN